MEQCIDDLICIERFETAASARMAWLSLAENCGWNIPLEKSPEASQLFRALGVFVNLKPLPDSAAEIRACKDRLMSIALTLIQVMETGRITPGLAASIAGKLLFTSSSFAGRYGKAMLRAFHRRAGEIGRSNLNPQLSASSKWWIDGLKLAPARAIPWKLDQLDVAISYSDGEGSDAGVGVAIWSRRLQLPEAGRLDIPSCIRTLWAGQRRIHSGELYDIQEIEGIGPLLVLSTWPEVLRHSLWMHFIDNNGALSCLVKGSSSCLGTDTCVLPWFDRVDTKSNPVDGLSRKVLAGPWRVVPLKFPAASLKSALRDAKRYYA